MGEMTLEELQRMLEEEREKNRRLQEDYNRIQDEMNSLDINGEVEKQLKFKLGLQELKTKYPDADIDLIEGKTLEEIEAKAKAIQDKVNAKIAEREARLKEEYERQWGVPLGGGPAAPIVTQTQEEIDRELEQAKQNKNLRGVIAAIRKKVGLDAWLNTP